MNALWAILTLLVCAGALWWTFDYLPEQERREGILRLLTTSIETCFDDAAPGEHLGIGEERCT